MLNVSLNYFVLWKCTFPYASYRTMAINLCNVIYLRVEGKYFSNKTINMSFKRCFRSELNFKDPGEDTTRI